MKRSLILAGLLCSVAAPAMAEPVTGLVIAVGAAWAGQAATAALVSAGLLASATGIGAAIVSIGIGAAISFIASKFLAPKVPDVAKQTVMFNPRQPVTYMERVYGIYRKGGPVAVTKFVKDVPKRPSGLTENEKDGWPLVSKTRDYRIIAVILAAHRIDGIEEWWIDDRQVVLRQTDSDSAGKGFIDQDPYGGEDISLRMHTGFGNQVADPLMVAAIPEWTASHDMAGLAYVRMLAKRLGDQDFNEVYPNGMPILTPVVRGNDRIYDPRTGTIGFSRNLALIFAHELTEYQGMEVDWDEVAYEADQCDTLMTTGDGTQRPRWRFDMSFSDDMDHAAIRNEFIVAGDLFFYERDDGKVGFKVGRWMEPTITLTRADFISIQISSVRDIDVANEYVTQYMEPTRAWSQSPTGTWIVDSEAGYSRKEIKAGGVASHYQAAALAKRTAREDHAEYKFTGTLKFVGFDLRGERFARIEIPEMGRSCAVEIKSLTLNEDGMTWSFTATSTNADDWTLGPDEEPARPIYDKLESYSPMDPVTSLQVVAGPSTSGSASLIATWAEQKDSYRQQLRYSVSGTEKWQTVDIPNGVTRHEVTGLLDGSQYEFQIRNIRSGKSSAWSPSVVVTAVANSVAPPALPRFDASGGSGQVILDFDTPNSPNYSATRIYRAKDSTSFANAVLVQTVYGSPNITDGWTDTGLETGSYTYWGLSINGSGMGNEATRNGPVTTSVL